VFLNSYIKYFNLITKISVFVLIYCMSVNLSNLIEILKLYRWILKFIL
jgi:hypothetical protein